MTSNLYQNSDWLLNLPKYFLLITSELPGQIMNPYYRDYYLKFDELIKIEMTSRTFHMIGISEDKQNL